MSIAAAKASGQVRLLGVGNGELVGSVPDKGGNEVRGVVADDHPGISADLLVDFTVNEGRVANAADFVLRRAAVGIVPADLAARRVADVVTASVA